MGKLATVQATLVARLTGDTFFTTADNAAPGVKVPVISKTRGDIAAAIDEAIANSGVGLVVLFVGAKRAADTRELVLECQWAITAIENPAAKADGIPTAEDIVEKVAGLLDWFPNGASPSDESDAGRFIVAPDAVDPLDATSDKRPELAALNILVLTLNTTITIN